MTIENDIQRQRAYRGYITNVDLDLDDKCVNFLMKEGQQSRYSFALKGLVHLAFKTVYTETPALNKVVIQYRDEKGITQELELLLDDASTGQRIFDVLRPLPTYFRVPLSRHERFVPAPL